MSSILAVRDRAKLLASLRAEIVGPSLFTDRATEVTAINGEIEIAEDVGPIFQRNRITDSMEEVLYDHNEGPTRKYGAGVLHPDWSCQEPAIADELEDSGFDAAADLTEDSDTSSEIDEDQEHGSDERIQTEGDDDDPDVTVTNRYKQSSMGVSICVSLPRDSFLRVELPSKITFNWQMDDDEPVLVNGLYRPINVQKRHRDGRWLNRGAWRANAFPPQCHVVFSAADIAEQRYMSREVTVIEGSPQNFDVVLVARLLNGEQWLITITLRNRTKTDLPGHSQFMLFQSYFEVKLTGGATYQPYPDPPQSTGHDTERESLALLYSRSKTWAIGHNCAAGWRIGEGDVVASVFADVFPVIETASMTPDIHDRDDNTLQFSMRELAELPDSVDSPVWTKLKRLESEYRHWIDQQKTRMASLEISMQPVANRHLADCELVCDRIAAGIETLKTNPNARIAFRLANKAMMLQQIATKILKPRKLVFNKQIGGRGRIVPEGECKGPLRLYEEGMHTDQIGNWRAFQLAFLLMHIPEFSNEEEPEFAGKRENIELIWFPTGGGKTEAYLGVAAYSMFLARLVQGDKESRGETFLPVDGTNILMRYTLRMLTTQQFQRAAALICAMECLRENFNEKPIAGSRFSLGLWIGGSSTPNRNEQAVVAIKRYQSKHSSQKNNPLVLTECPWCRAEIGLAEIRRPNGWNEKDWKIHSLRGVVDGPKPKLCCSDPDCPFEEELPVLVIDEQIYETPPSLVIATADKFAVISYRPDARAIFGRNQDGKQVHRPPFLIIQDETHLISGPLGTMFGLYESVIEVLCTTESNGVKSKPKVICSTATIRGAGEQLRSIFGRDSFTLFPPPGIDISDSFFGRYATEKDGRTLMPGRMYVGIHATPPGFVSAQTAQIRLYSTLLINVQNNIDEDRRDPWWTILCFYNSLRELGGARTLFQGDIPSRMKFLAHRDKLNFRNDPSLEELSSRLQQDEIVAMLDRLTIPFPKVDDWPLDVCLASNIIEVGVDIDRLSLMTVVGQPKNTAQYIQVTGRVGRRWAERPGLICTLYSATKLRDKSHFEQFYSYHSRLYEQVEPTTATPFSRASLNRATIGAMILYARCVCPIKCTARYADYELALTEAKNILVERCRIVEQANAPKQIQIIEDIYENMKSIWRIEREAWEKFTLGSEDSVLLRWPGQFATIAQRNTTFEVPSSLRQVDKSGELVITKHYLTPE